MEQNQVTAAQLTPADRAAIEADVRAKMEREAAERAAASANTPAAVLQREQERVSAILAAGDEFADKDGPALARELVKEPSATVETFKARMFEKMRGQTKPTPTAAPASQAPYGEGLRVRYTYGSLKAFRDLPLENGQVLKAEEAAHRAGMWYAASVHQKDWAKRWCRDHGLQFAYRDQVSGEVRVMAESSLSVGAALVPIELESAIIMLRDTYGVARQLARVRPMGSDTLQIPRRTGGITAYFFADDDGTGITASDKSWDNVNLAAKKLGALSRVSKDLIEDAVISVVDDLAQEMAYAFAKKEDECLIKGDGTSTYGGMQGFVPKFEGTAYLSRYTMTGHGTFATVDNADLTNVMGAVSQYALGAGAKFLVSAAAKAIVFGRLKAVAGGNRVDTLGMAPDDQYLGYPIVTSEAMYNVTTSLSNKAMILFGRFDLASSIGTRRGIEMQTLVERYAEFGQVGVLATERFDAVVHDIGSTTVKGAVSAGYGG